MGLRTATPIGIGLTTRAGGLTMGPDVVLITRPALLGLQTLHDGKERLVALRRDTPGPSVAAGSAKR